MKKNCCWTRHRIRDTVKVVLYLSHYATKKQLKHAIGIDISDFSFQKDFIALKDEVDKLDINKLVNVPTSANNLKINVDDLDVGKLKTVTVDLKKLSYVLDNEVVKNTKFYTLKTKVNTLEKKILDATTLIHIDQYNTGKKILEKKMEMLKKNKPKYKWFSDYNCFEYNISEDENKT